MATLREDLNELCLRSIRKQETYMWYMRDEDKRRKSRGDADDHATLLWPEHWSIDPAFNPYKVRKNLDAICASVTKQIQNHTFDPFNPIRLEVPKSKGKKRDVSVFPLVETVIATRVFKSLMLKNQVIMSGNSYAYRSDRSSHDAIKYLSREFQTGLGIYVAEFDFSDFFKSISHDVIRKNAESFGIVWTQTEKDLVWKYLSADLREKDDYQKTSQSPLTMNVGIHLGNSISLFAANIAALEMDRDIERTGVGYVRYADDTILWSEDKDKLEEAVRVLKDSAEKIGVGINESKSKGIRLLGEGSNPHHLERIRAVDYLGYSIGSSNTGLSSNVMKRVKSKISFLIWSNLLKSIIKSGGLNTARISPESDMDYTTLVLQIRRYVYGSMTEQKLDSLIRGTGLRIQFPGLMSNFPLVSDREQLAALDAWMVNEIWNALKIRRAFLLKSGLFLPKFPYSFMKRDLPNLPTRKSNSGAYLNVKLPSFEKIGTAIFQSSKLFGARAVSSGSKSSQYSYSLEAWFSI
jgi:hypothetical protein